MFCTNCGAQNPDGGKFCIKCGTPMSAPVQEEVVVAEPVAPAYVEPVVEAPVAPAYAEPVAQAPAYEAPAAPVEPAYTQPAQPTYQQPVYQQPVYQQPVYQQPVYSQPTYTQPEDDSIPGKPFGIIGMIFGILSIVFFWTLVFGIIFGAIGLIFSIIAMKKAKSVGRKNPMGLVGVICSAVGLGLLGLVFGSAFMEGFMDGMGHYY